jgi:hypothetical protein
MPMRPRTIFRVSKASLSGKGTMPSNQSAIGVVNRPDSRAGSVMMSLGRIGAL